ncbi:MAG: HlyC/CorC family transporter [Clostridia bacterium]|nr:HlyC/CorC family transporter [Clostridia bacterium]
MTDDPGPNCIWQIILLICLLLISFFFALCETAVGEININKMAKMAEEGNRKAKKLLKLTDDSSRFPTAIQISTTFAGFLTVAFASVFFAPALAEWVALTIGIHNLSGTAVKSISTASVVVITAIVSHFALVLGKMVPRRIALHNIEKVAFAFVGLACFINAFCRPFVAILTLSGNIVLRLFGIDPNKEEKAVTEDEILLLVDAGEETGAIEENQAEMINNIFEFDDIVASEVMTHRTDMVAVDLNDSTLDDVVKLAITEGCSRIPAYDGDIDDIKGIIYVKDLLKYVGHDLPKGELSSLLRKAHFVPESKRCGELFTEMTEKHLQMCIVSDEYGGTAGLVTIEDLLESIVGNIQDEYDDEDEDNIEQIDETTFTVDGTALVDEISDLLDTELPEGDYDTVGGMIMSIIGRIPDENENISVTVAGCEFTVEGVSERRIERVRIEKLPQTEEEEE